MTGVNSQAHNFNKYRIWLQVAFDNFILILETFFSARGRNVSKLTADKRYFTVGGLIKCFQRRL